MNEHSTKIPDNSATICFHWNFFGKSALSFLLLFIANVVQLLKATVQSVMVSFVQNESVVVSFIQNESVVVSFVQNESVVVSFVQNESVVVSFVQSERNTLYQIDVIQLLICDKDRIFFSLRRSFSPKIFCLCLHSPLC